MTQGLTFTYTNYRSETAERRVAMDGIRFHHGSTEFHPEPQPLMTAFDLDRQALRDFAVRDVVFGPVAKRAEMHPDDLAVEKFSAAMREKLATARAKGRGGWEDPAGCTAQGLSAMLREHVVKGDPVDVANFCMMLQQRGQTIVGDDVDEHGMPLHRSMESAPRDHTILRLLVEFDSTGAWMPLTDDARAWTIGSNGFDHTGIDDWQFVGWSWSQDCFTDCTAPQHGRVVGWLPFYGAIA